MGLPEGDMTGFLHKLAVSSVVFFATVAESSETYFCSFVALNKSDWIPPQVAMQLSDNRKSAQVWASEAGTPVAANMERRSDSSYLLDWTASRSFAAKATGLIGDRYRVILNVENMKVSLQVLSEIASVPHSSRGAGTCVLVENVLN